MWVLWTLIIVGVVLFQLGRCWWHHLRGREVIDAWAHRNGWIVLSRRFCFWRSSLGRPTYRISIKNNEDCERSGYARCGRLTSEEGPDLMCDDIDITWDE